MSRCAVSHVKTNWTVPAVPVIRHAEVGNANLVADVVRRMTLWKQGNALEVQLVVGRDCKGEVNRQELSPFMFRPAPPRRSGRSRADISASVSLQIPELLLLLYHI